MGSIQSQSVGFDVPMDSSIGNTALGARLDTMHRSGQRALEELLNTGNLGITNYRFITNLGNKDPALK